MSFFISIGPAAGYLVAILVFLLVSIIYAYCEFVLLSKSRILLNADKIALETAKAILRTMATKHQSGVAPEEVYTNLSQLPEDSAIYKRVQTLATHRAKNAISPVDRVALIETESARQQAGTNWPRFWAGAFTFIGLIGTLLGLSIAVFHLIAIVGTASTDATDGSTLTQITSGMTATFSGMGGAFLSTAAGVFFSVVLSTTISKHEYKVESFRLDFEEFSHLQLEPFVSRAQIALREGENGLVVGGVWEEIDELAPMKALVDRIDRASQTFDDIAHSFAGSMQKAAQSFETLHSASDSTAASLQNSSSAFFNSVRALEASISPISKQIESLNQVLESQTKSQEAFLQHAYQSVARLENSTQSATLAFEKLAQIETSWETKLEKQNGIFESHLGDLSATVSTIPISVSASIQQELALLSGLLKPLPEYILESGKSFEAAIRNSQKEERELVAQLSSLVLRLGEYTSQMDDSIGRHVAAAYAKPLAEFDTKSFEVARQLGENVVVLQKEISGLKNAFVDGRKNSDVKGELQAQSEKFQQLGDSLTRIDSVLRRLETTPDVSQSWLYSVDRLMRRFDK